MAGSRFGVCLVFVRFFIGRQGNRPNGGLGVRPFAIPGLYAVLCRNPGETMTTLAPQVGAPPRALHRAVARLKRVGRVRTVGQRQHTRYFPMTNVAAAWAS